MLKKILIVVAIAIVVITIAGYFGATSATPRCAPYDAMVEELGGLKYKEKHVGGGLINETGVAAIFVGPEGKTWSFVVVRPDGWTCLIAAGRDWEGMMKPLPGEAL
jgi:hypothetical protein